MNPQPLDQARRDNFTLLGAGGYMGSELLERLTRRGYRCRGLGRSDSWDASDDLGHVIFCIGLTADFRWRPLETIAAHVCRAIECLQSARFESFLYLSSTRVYGRVGGTREDVDLIVNPSDPDDLYNLSKLAGEAACRAISNPRVRIVRLSNVYGGRMTSHSFLTELITSAHEGRICLRTNLDSEKDYIHIEDVCDLLPSISLSGKNRLYNVASGENVSHRRILDILARETGCSVEVDPAAPTVCTPRIDVGRVTDEFDFTPRPLEHELAAVVRTAGETATRA